MRYVDLASANPTPPYTNWATAATNIQDAVDVAVAGDEIIVTNGVYTAGGRALGTNLLVNRVAVDKPLTVRSVNGPEFTLIQGHQVPGATNGDGAVRCVYLAEGANLAGFTMVNGATRTDGDWEREQSGGGVWCESTNAVVSNCVITGNSASYYGGGAFHGMLSNCTLAGNTGFFGGGACDSTLNNCILTSNTATSDCGGGGGAFGGTLNNCTLAGNTANSEGGGAAHSTLNNCTLTDNLAAYFGGGVWSSTLNNCIIHFNSDRSGGNYDTSSTLNYCCTTPMPTNGVGNITNAPQFVDYPGGNLRLQSDSPCINAGLNTYAPGPADLAGLPRIGSGTVDIGAYEGSGSRISYAWLHQFGLATDGSVDDSDLDGDGYDTWKEWRCHTDPKNAVSALRLLSASYDGTNAVVTWQGVAGVSYSLEYATNLANSTPFMLLATDIPGQPGTTTYVDTNATTLAPLFYRVGVP